MSNKPCSMFDDPYQQGAHIVCHVRASTCVVALVCVFVVVQVHLTLFICLARCDPIMNRIIVIISNDLHLWQSQVL